MNVIGINAQLLSNQRGYRQAGIHKYIANTLNAIPQNDDFQYAIFTQNQSALPPRSNRKLHHTQWPTEQRIGRIFWEQLVYPTHAKKLGCNLLHSMAFVTPALTSLPTIVTVYDLSFLHFPDNYPAAQRHYLTTQTRRSCRHSARVITISNSAKQDINHFFDVPLDRIDVAFPGVDSIFKRPDAVKIQQFKSEQQLPDTFILHVGTLQPRKNLTTLIEAFAQLIDQEPDLPSDLELVIAGGKGWFYEEIFQTVQKFKLENRVRFPGYVPDEALPLWYSAAAAVAMPSIYEGFGIPLAEAMACKTPVIASNVSSMPEVVGNAGILVPPNDISAWANGLANILQNKTLTDKMRRNGFQQVQKFRWEAAGQTQLSSYQKVLIS